MGIIDWQKLLKAQSELDKYIFETKKLDYKATSDKRFLAIIVELNELANATKCFKFGSSKTGDRSDILAEYVDVLHFILASALDQNITFEDFKFSESDSKSKTMLEFFTELNMSMGELRNREGFLQGVRVFLLLSKCLGLSGEEIDKAYFEKGELNFKRQHQGY